MRSIASAPPRPPVLLGGLTWTSWQASFVTDSPRHGIGWNISRSAFSFSFILSENLQRKA